MERRAGNLCGIPTRTLCLIIGYFHLASIVVDILCHLLTVGYVTNGFQCDVDSESLKTITEIQFLGPLLLILNLGIHGFYPFPHIIRNQYNTYVEYMDVTSAPRCYPGFLHVYIVDVLNFIINMIWLKFVISYLKGVYKKQHEPVSMFLSLSVVKLVMQIMYLGYYPQSFEGRLDFQTFWLLKLLDVVIAFYIIMVIKRYVVLLKAKKNSAKIVEKPPSYFECLIGVNKPVTKVTKLTKESTDTVINFVEVTKGTENIPKHICKETKHIHKEIKSITKDIPKETKDIRKETQDIPKETKDIPKETKDIPKET